MRHVAGLIDQLSRCLSISSGGLTKWSNGVAFKIVK